MIEAGAVFLPLLGALIAGFFGRSLGDRGAQAVTVGCMAVAALCGTLLFIDVALGGNARTVVLATWIDSGSFEANWALRYDTLSAVMVGMVTLISTLIHIYSV
ncbi:MAG: NADH-quinone oxidoreductase subunit L, partial [Acetobacteraceae bacterium]|nr:NADH-quinone oxidoreductase subunit L [Acetobacteraceae bacterium]